MCFTGKLPGAELMDWVYNALNALGEVNTLAHTVLGVGTPSESGPPSELIEIVDEELLE